MTEPPSADRGESTAGQSTSTSLLERVRANDRQSWQELVERYGGLVLHWCRQAGLQPEDRADVFQEVFRAVARHIGEFERRASGETFRGWLRTVTRSKLADHFRRRQHAPIGQGGSTIRAWLDQVPEEFSDSSMDVATADEDAILMRAAIGRVRAEFGERPWQAFWRTMVDGLPTETVADELGITASAIYAAKSRILKRLREEMHAV